jgi:hypothetical protein
MRSLIIYTLRQILSGGHIREDEMDRANNTRDRAEKCIQILFGKAEGRRPSGRPRCRWENYFNIKEKECESMDWVFLLQHKD